MHNEWTEGDQRKPSFKALGHEQPFNENTNINKLRYLRQIAIDEISIGKGHPYLTVVLDLETGAVVYVGHGKGGDASTDFWKRLRRCGAKIEAIATDMSPAYIDVVMTHLPEAVLVFDRFHVMKLFNGKLSDLRRERSNKAFASGYVDDLLFLAHYDEPSRPRLD